MYEAGHDVARTPPYHPEYQPIELVWGLIKKHVADNQTFKLTDCEALIRAGIDSITPAMCAAYARRCIEICERDSAHLVRMEERELIINLDSEGSSDDSSSDGNGVYEV